MARSLEPEYKLVQLPIRDISKNPNFKETFSDAWVEQTSQTCDAYYGLEFKKKVLAHCAISKSQYGIVINLLATEPRHVRCHAASRLLNLISKEYGNQPLLALALESSNSFWLSSGFVKCNSAKIRALLCGKDPTNLSLEVFTRIHDFSTRRCRR